jgi:hypothetical protein
VSAVTRLIEALVGLACLLMAFPCWARGGTVFRAVAVVLGLAGVVAIGNALLA